MPTYEYRCDKCGKFEYDQKITEPHLTKCPTCGKAVKRLISASGIVFKGSGFHITDYSKKPSGNQEKAAPASASSCVKADSCPNKASCPSKS